MRIKVAVSLVLATLLVGALISAGTFVARAREADRVANVVGRNAAESSRSNHRGGSSGGEVLVGVVYCNVSFSEYHLGATFSGTIDVKQTAGFGGSLVDILVGAEACPQLTKEAADRVSQLGCTHGAVGTFVDFVCEGDRDQMVQIMASLSRSVVTAQF